MPFTPTLATCYKLHARDSRCLSHALSWIWLTPENTTCSLDDDGDSPQLASTI